MPFLANRGYADDLVGNIDDEKGRARLAAVSPINFAAEITAPLLIVHGKDDRNVPLAQARAMVDALGRAGHPPETPFSINVGHYRMTEDNGVDFLKTVERFLDRNLAQKN